MPSIGTARPAAVTVTTMALVGLVLAGADGTGSRTYEAGPAGATVLAGPPSLEGIEDLIWDLQGGRDY